MDKWTQATINLDKILKQQFQALDNRQYMTVILERRETWDKLPIYLDFLPRGTFKNAAKESGVQTGSSWVEEAEIRGADTAGICAAGYWKRSCIKKELQKYA